MIEIPAIHSLEAERQLLGGMLLDPENVVDDASALLRPDDFWHVAHRTIYRGMIAMRDASMPIDPSTLFQYLTDRDEAGGGVDALIGELSAGAIGILTAPTHIATIRDKARIRAMVDACRKTVADLIDRQHEPDAALDAAEMRLYAATERPQDINGLFVGDGVKEVYKGILEVSERGDGLIGHPTGFSELDKATAGIENSMYWIIGARPNVGKTNLALSWMLYQAEKGIPVCMISGDSPGRDSVRRLLSMVSGVGLTAIRSGAISENDSAKLAHAGDILSKLPIYFYHLPGLPLAQIRAISRKEKRKHGTQIFYIDYIQIIGVPGCKGKVEEVQKASGGIKELAGELDVAIVGLAQVGRGVEKENRVPGLSDLKESGQIEQDADFVAFIHRDRESKDPGAMYKTEGLLLPAKGRDIVAKMLRIYIDPDTARFGDAKPDGHDYRQGVPFS